MKRYVWLPLLAAIGLAACSASNKASVASETSNTLLWKISGRNLSKPSYLFGTMHMLCADDIQVSDSLKSAIKNADKVYLELDMDDMLQMLSAMGHMTMKGDTTLSDLLTADDYKKVKTYFEDKSSLIPFSMLEKFKPLLIESMVMEQSADCDHMIVMEQLIMQEAKKNNKQIGGLETMDYQLSLFDSIPYKLQALQLVKMVENEDVDINEKEMQQLTDAYKQQKLDVLEQFTKNEDMGIRNFTDLLLYNRNANWAKKLQDLMTGHSLVIAVGAGHLPGEKGVLNLLRKAGYKIEPVKNEMVKKKVQQI